MSAYRTSLIPRDPASWDTTVGEILQVLEQEYRTGLKMGAAIGGTLFSVGVVLFSSDPAYRYGGLLLVAAGAKATYSFARSYFSQRSQEQEKLTQIYRDLRSRHLEHVCEFLVENYRTIDRATTIKQLVYSQQSKTSRRGITFLYEGKNTQ